MYRVYSIEKEKERNVVSKIISSQHVRIILTIREDSTSTTRDCVYTFTLGVSGVILEHVDIHVYIYIERKKIISLKGREDDGFVASSL